MVLFWSLEEIKSKKPQIKQNFTSTPYYTCRKFDDLFSRRSVFFFTRYKTYLILVDICKLKS